MPCRLKDSRREPGLRRDLRDPHNYVLACSRGNPDPSTKVVHPDAGHGCVFHLKRLLVRRIHSDDIGECPRAVLGCDPALIVKKHILAEDNPIKVVGSVSGKSVRMLTVVYLLSGTDWRREEVAARVDPPFEFRMGAKRRCRRGAVIFVVACARVDEEVSLCDCHCAHSLSFDTATDVADQDDVGLDCGEG